MIIYDYEGTYTDDYTSCNTSTCIYSNYYEEPTIPIKSKHEINAEEARNSASNTPYTKRRVARTIKPRLNRRLMMSKSGWLPRKFRRTR